MLVAEALQQFAGLAVERGLAREPATGDLVPEEDVLGDGEAVDDVELLVHRRDAQLDRGLRIRDLDGLAEPLAHTLRVTGDLSGLWFLARIPTVALVLIVLAVRAAILWYAIG